MGEQVPRGSIGLPRGTSVRRWASRFPGVLLDFPGEPQSGDGPLFRGDLRRTPAGSTAIGQPTVTCSGELRHRRPAWGRGATDERSSNSKATCSHRRQQRAVVDLAPGIGAVAVRRPGPHGTARDRGWTRISAAAVAVEILRERRRRPRRAATRRAFLARCGRPQRGGAGLVGSSGPGARARRRAPRSASCRRRGGGGSPDRGGWAASSSHPTTTGPSRRTSGPRPHNEWPEPVKTWPEAVDPTRSHARDVARSRPGTAKRRGPPSRGACAWPRSAAMAGQLATSPARSSAAAARSPSASALWRA